MSLYNALFGMNPASDLFLGVLGLTREDVGRFCDAYARIDDGEPVIVVYTKNGGGNRFHDDVLYEGLEGENCLCTGCIITHKLPKHQSYLRDWDDGVYASIEFSVPTQLREAVLSTVQNQSTGTPEKHWQDLLGKLDSADPNDPDVARALKIMSPVMEKIVEAIEGS